MTWRRQRRDIKLGNLSTDVFEPRTATGSRMFSFLAWFCSLPWTGKLVFLCLRFDVTNVVLSKSSKEGKVQLPVDVRGSKTSVLKFPKFVPCFLARVFLSFHQCALVATFPWLSCNHFLLSRFPTSSYFHTRTHALVSYFSRLSRSMLAHAF